MTTPLRVLVIEDSEADCDLLVRALRQGYDVKHKRIDSAAALRASLDTQAWDIVLSDHSMPGFSGTAALAMIRERGLDVPFIFVSGTIGEDAAVDAMRVGAQDYIMKGNLARLLPAVEREVREAEIRRERRSVEQRMHQLEKFEVIGRLAGGIAHDFNNVIGAIMGWATLGYEAVPSGSRAANLFQQIVSQSERATGLTRQLLAYARRQILEPRNVNLNQVITETTALVQKVTGDYVEVEFVLAPDLQATRADPAQIEQVLLNLCVNARDAMPKGGRVLIETCNVELDQDYCRQHVYGRPGRYVRLSVSDTGVGMDAATIERIFEPFFTTKEVGKGTGLGLSTALGIVKQHEGSIEVTSEPGKGTTFHIYLPPSQGSAEPRAPAARETEVCGGTETILVADDHDGLRELAQEMLESLGYRVVLARDGEEAVQKFEAHRSDISLVVMDVVMPKVRGPDAYAKISQLKPGVPAIFTSGYSEDEAGLAPMVARGALVLEKPYGPKILARKVRELLDGTRGVNRPSE
ncbi:MAG: response regulator [Candidatus Acidiferrales bacterium]